MNSADLMVLLRSVSTVHFTGAIAQNTSEEENIAIAHNKIAITGLNMMAKEAKSYRVWLSYKDTFDDAAIDSDELAVYILADLTAGLRYKNTGFYRYSTTFATPYLLNDKDLSKEVHIALENLSAVAKTAGSDGALVIELVGYVIG